MCGDFYFECGQVYFLVLHWMDQSPHLTSTLFELINQRLIIKLILLFILHLYDFSTDLCSPMACGHICVNAKSGPRCLCAEGFQLAADGKKLYRL